MFVEYYVLYVCWGVGLVLYFCFGHLTKLRIVINKSWSTIQGIKAALKSMLALA